MEVRNVIIDCDPGIDDSLALMLALASPELRVLGVTTVCGNVLSGAGSGKCPEGAQTDGMGESWIEDVTEAEARPGAVDFILESLRKEERVSVLAIGPMTNVALALKKDREAFRRLDMLISMGGF